tara:strand:- start:554 stop:2365 length:1812 start_codon:yes stop_codon:yes gene_type:complete
LNLKPYIIFILSIIFVTILWDYINLPYNFDTRIVGDSYHLTNHHPQNDTIRFLLFLGIPFISLIIFYQYNNKNFLSNFKNLFKDQVSQNQISNKYLNKFFLILVSILLFEFFLIDFKNQTYLIDLFHEGLWLSASQNLKDTNQLWLSSYIARGLFGNFHPSFFWDLLGYQSIGVTRFFNLFIVLINKILLILIARQLSVSTNFKKNEKIIFFLSLAISFLYFTSYGSPLFFKRSFLLLLFSVFLINFFLTKKNQKFYVLILGLFSSFGMFWYVDIGIYINLTILIFAALLVIRTQYRYFNHLILSLIFGWCFIYFLFPQDEFYQFIDNTILIFSTIEHIQGLIYPTPFLSMDTRSTKALIIFLITGFVIISAINKLSLKDKNFFLITSILFVIGLIYFKYGLSRSDSGHIRNASAFLYLSTVSIIYFLVLNFLSKKKEFLKIKSKFIFLSLITLFLISAFTNKKYEDKNIRNLLEVKNSISLLLNYKDEEYLTEDYIKFINYYEKLSKEDNCVMIFTNEVALSYLLRKKSCSKYYLMYSATPNKIQKSLVKDINNEQPSFIVYKSDVDLYGDNMTRLSFVNNFIKENYSFYEKFKYWEIYKKN